MSSSSLEDSITRAPPTCETHYRVRGYETDRDLRLKPETMFQFFTETAGHAARTAGGAPERLREESLSWFLIRFHMEIGRYPRRGEEITLRTWLHRMKGVTSIREFKLLGGDGTEIGGATTQWAMVDMKKRAPTRLPEWYVSLFTTLSERQIEDPFRNMKAIEKGATEHRFHVRLSDLDANRHATAPSYADWFLETVPDDVHDTLVPLSLEIHYKIEANYRDRLRVVSAPEKCSDDGTGDGIRYVHTIYRNGEEAPLALARSRWGKESLHP